MGSPDGSAYISGLYILPVTLKYIYEISRFVNVPVVGVGGVTDHKAAVQMIMAGASGVGMVTAPMLDGLEVFNKVAAGLESYLETGEFDSLSEIRGLTHRRIEEREASFGLKAGIDPVKCNSCGLCESVCFVEAIDSEREYSIYREKCVSCGLCESVCPVNAISLD